MYDVVRLSVSIPELRYVKEVVLLISGDSGAVKQAVKAARDVGLALLETMGERPKNKGNAYII